MLTKIYLAVSVGLLGLYFYATQFGWELESEERQVAPVSVRQSPGGYRSFHFWHSGYHGGK